MFLQANSKWTLAKRANKNTFFQAFGFGSFQEYVDLLQLHVESANTIEGQDYDRTVSNFFQEIFSASFHPCVGLGIAATLLFLLIIILIFSATFFHLLILMLIFSTDATFPNLLGVQLVKTEDPPSWFDQHKSRCDALSGAINTLSPAI